MLSPSIPQKLDKKFIVVIGPKRFEPNIGAIIGGIVICVCRVFLTFAKLVAHEQQAFQELGPSRSTPDKNETECSDFQFTVFIANSAHSPIVIFTVF